MSVQNVEELAANVGRDVGAEWWVKPSNVSLPSSLGVL